MMHFTMAEARRQLTDIVNRVAYGGERIALGRRGKGLAVVVSVEDAAVLEALEDSQDARDAKRVLAEMKRRGEKPIAWEEVKAELAAKRGSRASGEKG